MIKKRVRAATAVEAAAARKSQGRAEAAADSVAVAVACKVLPPEVAAAAAPKSTVRRGMLGEPTHLDSRASPVGPCRCLLPAVSAVQSSKIFSN